MWSYSTIRPYGIARDLFFSAPPKPPKTGDPFHREPIYLAWVWHIDTYIISVPNAKIYSCWSNLIVQCMQGSNGNGMKGMRERINLWKEVPRSNSGYLIPK